MDGQGIHVEDCKIVKNAWVYGLDESIRRAKFPMATDLSSLTGKLTSGIKALAQSGQGKGHDNFLNGIIVQFDLTFTNKAWVEMERYHFIDFVSSQSTMHRITQFNLDESYCQYVDPRIVDIMKKKVDSYNKLLKSFSADDLKGKYLEILYSNPAGFLLTAGMTTNYRQLKTIYQQRKEHRLPEWKMFCRWIETLPMSELITGAAVREEKA